MWILSNASISSSFDSRSLSFTFRSRTKFFESWNRKRRNKEPSHIIFLFFHHHQTDDWILNVFSIFHTFEFLWSSEIAVFIFFELLIPFLLFFLFRTVFRFFEISVFLHSYWFLYLGLWTLFFGRRFFRFLNFWVWIFTGSFCAVWASQAGKLLVFGIFFFYVFTNRLDLFFFREVFCFELPFGLPRSLLENLSELGNFSITCFKFGVPFFPRFPLILIIFD